MIRIFLDPAVAQDQLQMKTETIVAMMIETIAVLENILTMKMKEITTKKLSVITVMAIVKVTTITRNTQQVDSSSNAETRSIQNSIIQGKPER